MQISRAGNVGPVLVKRLFRRFGSVEKIAGASNAALMSVEGVGEKTAAALRKAMQDGDVDREIELCEANNIKITTLEGDDYPALLKETPYAPAILYYKGNIPRERLAVAVVGARRCSLYGEDQAGIFGAALGQCGATVVSGLARGVDSAAHRGALISRGITVAVLGTGLLHIYPKENRALFEEIEQTGACISQFSPDTEPRAENFVPRNKIIAGMSLGTLVVEAGPTSGAMSTAGFSKDTGRPVFALPGRVDSLLSRGPHELIMDGAHLVRNAADILNVLDSSLNHTTQTNDELPLFPSSPEETAILASLKLREKHTDEIITETGLPAGAVNAAIFQLQLKKSIKKLPGNRFALNKRL
ncbi:MAG: DNA-processing protein DprA [Phycisphaerae bacterium]|jgi:DNA processing protein